ncbi:Putative germin-like protein 2-1 [Linum perenne]
MAFTLCHVTFASDPSSVQDFCVADFNNQVKLNGFACKDPARVQADDFSFSGMHIYGNTGNSHGSLVTPMTVTQIPGLNTLGISMGTLEVGFVTSNPEYRLISKTLQKGDVFVFPVGLIHFQRNVGKTNAVVIAALSSQNPGVVTVANAVFGSKPDIATDLLAKAFQVDKNIVQQLQWKF